MAENSQPTEAELSILRVLWERGPSTVREVFEVQSADRAPGYTTVLKFLQIMHQKGLVTRDESSKIHIYTAAIPAEKMQRKLVRNLMDKVFSGSVSQLMLHALGSKKASAAELKDIRALLDEMEGKASTKDKKP